MDFAELAGLAGAHVEARALQVAVKLGLFDALDGRTLDAPALAESLGTEMRATAILANAFVALGLITQANGRYGLAEAAARHLVKTSDAYLGGMILFDEALFPIWTKLEASIRSGRPARTPDMFQSSPAETERFIRAMDSLVRARGDARWVASNLGLDGVRSIADVGGGPGTYMIDLLRERSGLRAAIYDLPATLEVARAIIRERAPWALARLELVEVDYLRDELPGPCDALFLSNIIHSEDEPTNRELLRKCFRALTNGGYVIIKDHIMNRELTAPRAGAIFSLYLLLTTRGRDYSFDELAAWLTDAGFGDVRCDQLPNPPFTSSLVRARKP
jgi:SAM-dependent methyltransferase